MIIIISNFNRTEWSPIRFVIIREIDKTGRPRSGSLICFITSMITNRIGRHKVLLPIEIPRFLLAVKKKSHLSARVMARTIQA